MWDASRVELARSFGIATATTFTFLAGAACSGIAGYAGLWVSVRVNVRVAAAATQSYHGQ